MRQAPERGFTLVELLVVVAIIAILGSMVFVVGPRALERAKLASLGSVFTQFRTALVGYSTETKNKGSFPPAYGYVVWKDPNNSAPSIFFQTPYVAPLGLFREFNMYDKFGLKGYDTDHDGTISLLEFLPIGSKSATEVGRYDFPVDIYDGTNFQTERDAMAGQQRPLAYIPVNSEQAKKVAQYYLDRKNKQNDIDDFRIAASWKLTDSGGNPTPLAKLSFPPVKYDAFVLISVGPGENTGGILTPPLSFLDDVSALGRPDDFYNIYALRAYYLATQDEDDDKIPDYDYSVRDRPSKKLLPNQTPRFHAPGNVPQGLRPYGPVIYNFAG